MSNETEKPVKGKSSNRKSTGKAGDKTISVPEEIDISHYISNVEGNIYAISGLPEEFIATLFAWVSRSPKSFKEHLRKAAKEFQLPKGTKQFDQLNKKAKDFHEKWTVGYGHSSVAEHANAHVGIEKVSRLASAELELSNTFYSITEYSQRYQKPERGDWHNPHKAMVSHSGPTRDMKPNPLHKKFEEFMNNAYDAFVFLINSLFQGLLAQEDMTGLTEEETKRKTAALEKLAFEDARYVLPLAMHTQLGMTANGRAWRDGIASLGTSDYPEVHKMANDLRTEITKVLPVLLKYAEPSTYQINSKKRIAGKTKAIRMDDEGPRVRLIDIDTEVHAINKIVAAWLVQNEGYSYTNALYWAKKMDTEFKIDLINDSVHEMQHFDNPPEAFKRVRYSVELCVSEANWHQLLRHNRKTDFQFSEPSVYHGITIPPGITELGLEHVIYDIEKQARELYEECLASDVPETADYVVLNAHNRQVVADLNLWEAYHLINLRTSDEAQWDIRQTFERLHNLLKTLHPNLIEKAQRRQG